MQVELNARGKEIQRIMDALADVPYKTFYGMTMEEYVAKIKEQLKK